MAPTDQRPLLNGSPSQNKRPIDSKTAFEAWNKKLKGDTSYGQFHGDQLLADKHRKQTKLWWDLVKVFDPSNIPEILKVAVFGLTGRGLDKVAGAQLIGSIGNDSAARAGFIESQVQAKYEKMLHPPVTYLGDAFQYRAPDGKFNSVIHPHLGAAGAPYAKTVPSKTHQLGALPDPGDIFDRLMAREPKGRDSPSGLSSMLVYHATIIIHDIFRTNDTDKNLSDSSSYLDLSPLYGYNIEMQRKVRDGKFKLGLLKPDTFAEDRLLRQPPGVCIMLVMYNRYHNYAATQLKRINENGRFSVPSKFNFPNKWEAAAEFSAFKPVKKEGKKGETDKAYKGFQDALSAWKDTWKQWVDQGQKSVEGELDDDTLKAAEEDLKNHIYHHPRATKMDNEIDKFLASYDAAWDKLDDDLFNTARLITCGLYINVSIHDYLRALMGMHQYNTNFTLDPRGKMDHKNVSRGLGNQVTVEFNLLYRFHCAISQRDERYTEDFMKEAFEEAKSKTDAARKEGKPVPELPDPKNINLKDLSMSLFGALAKQLKDGESGKEPWLVEFGLKNASERSFKRNTITGLFDDEQMIRQLKESMDDPISNFGPQNTPRCLKNVEIMGILQARKWEIGTLNDFRDFFGMGRHKTFEQISGNPEVQNALRDLYEHPDKVELYPGIFCESDANKGDDPGPSDVDSALWAAIFSDAITLVRSDRFYTVDWNTNSLTSWGMKEVSPDYDNLKTSVFHRLLQRAFPEWFPYDSIRFFHPFYTAEANAQYAQEQGYFKDFNLREPNFVSAKSRLVYPASEPKKPRKPWLIESYKEIKAVLDTGANEIIHPAFVNADNLPPKVQAALQQIQSKKSGDSPSSSPKNDPKTIKRYFSYQMRAIIEREVVTMSSAESGPVYSIDITRDVAIPVITRCIADFLGFSDQIRNIWNPDATFSENEIYQHILNCQTFLSYNADETKLIQRRADFKKSMNFLLKLTERGNISEARWMLKFRKNMNKVPGAVTDCFNPWAWFKSTPPKMPQDEREISATMSEEGMKVALRLLDQVKDSGTAAAILLLTALDVAYISVLAFTTSLDYLLQGAYNAANKPGSPSPDWFELQRLALKADGDDDGGVLVADAVKKIVLKAQKASIKLPFIRRVVKDGLTITINNKKEKLSAGDAIICDIHKAMNSKDAQLDHLNYATSLSTNLIGFNPKDIAEYGLIAMIKVTAQMQNLRRGHTSQGFIKRVQIDQTSEGYANFMADGRMKLIAHDAEHAEEEVSKYESGKKSSPEEAAHKKFLDQRVIDAKKVYSQDVLKPEQDTYLTAEWDEMVPFPTTWKLRFEGYGISTYGGEKLPKLQPPMLPDSQPPFYQPQGPSQYGGSFADAAGGGDIATLAKKMQDDAKKKGDDKEDDSKRKAREWPNGFPCDWTDVTSKGCGAPAPVLHEASKELAKSVCK